MGASLDAACEGGAAADEDVPASASHVRSPSDDGRVDQLYAALIGIAAGALGSHLLTQQRERAGERRRARNICRLLFRDLFPIYIESMAATANEGGWPSEGRVSPIKTRLDHWRRLGPDFTMVCRDDELWESLALAFEEAEYLAEGHELSHHRLEKAVARIADGMERTGNVNKPWSAKLKARFNARKQDDD